MLNVLIQGLLAGSGNTISKQVFIPTRMGSLCVAPLAVAVAVVNIAASMPLF